MRCPLSDHPMQVLEAEGPNGSCRGVVIQGVDPDLDEYGYNRQRGMAKKVIVIMIVDLEPMMMIWLGARMMCN